MLSRTGKGARKAGRAAAVKMREGDLCLKELERRRCLAAAGGGEGGRRGEKGGKKEREMA